METAIGRDSGVRFLQDFERDRNARSPWGDTNVVTASEAW